MSARRTLVSRQQREIPSSPAPRGGRQSDAPRRQLTALPPYQPPSCPLTAKAQQSIAAISANHDYKKYEKHINAAIGSITACVAESNDRLYESKEKVEKLAERRLAADENAEKSEAEERAEEKAAALGRKVDRLTAESEKALRELIDFKEELAQQDRILKTVAEDSVASASAAELAVNAGRNKNKRRRDAVQDNSDDEDATYQHEAEEEDDSDEMVDVSNKVAILSPTELLKKAKDEYTVTYLSQNMRSRYGAHNDYKNFKRVVHDAQNPGDNAPPVPHASTWFPEEDGTQHTTAARSRRMALRTDNTDNEEDDDEIQMTGIVSSLKCPLTLQTFREPYSNNVCKHTFEKEAILEYHRANATAFLDPTQTRRGRGVPQGPKLLKCPERGCEAMIKLEDFYDDQIILRQVKRQAAQAAAEARDDDMEDEPPMRSQRTKVEQTGDDTAMLDDEDEETAQPVPKVKTERMGKGRSRSRTITQDESNDDDD